MTLEQWRADANLRPELEKLLTDPVMLIALDIVRQKATQPIIPPAGVDIVHFGSMMGYKRDGFFEALQSLINLSRVVKSKPPEKSAWVTAPPPEEQFADVPEIQLPPELISKPAAAEQPKPTT
jgi:hypothetical protein